MKRTLERELKVPEVAEREAIETSPVKGDCRPRSGRLISSGQPAVWVGSVLVGVAP